MKRLSLTLIALSLGVSPTVAYADCDLSEVVGWTLLAEKTVDGFIEPGKRDDSYEGCDFDRIITFTDGTGLRCTGYHYTYAYRPEAYIFADGPLLKACIEDEWVDLQPIR